MVDADPEARTRISGELAALGLEVSGAAHGRAGLRLVEEESPDVVVLELAMPVMDGMSFLQRLRQNPYHMGIPVVVFTEKELTRSEEVALEDRASAVVRKGEGELSRLRDVLGRIVPLRDPLETEQPS